MYESFLFFIFIGEILQTRQGCSRHSGQDLLGSYNDEVFLHGPSALPYLSLLAAVYPFVRGVSFFFQWKRILLIHPFRFFPKSYKKPKPEPEKSPSGAILQRSPKKENEMKRKRTEKKKNDQCMLEIVLPSHFFCLSFVFIDFSYVFPWSFLCFFHP